VIISLMSYLMGATGERGLAVGMIWSNSADSHVLEPADPSRLVLGFHIGTGGEPVVSRGPGGALINDWETTVPGQCIVTHLVGEARDDITVRTFERLFHPGGGDRG
jgi:hypothetical protein